MMLPEPHMQNTLFLEIVRSSTKPKECEHAVFREDEDGSVSAFSVSSPALPKSKRNAKKASKPKKGANDKQSKTSASVSADEDLPSLPPMCETPGSLHSADTFMRELEDLAKDAETVDTFSLATNPEAVVDPGVQEENVDSSATTAIEDIGAAVPLASSTPTPLISASPIDPCVPPPKKKKKRKASPRKNKANNKINKTRGSFRVR